MKTRHARPEMLTSIYTAVQASPCFLRFTTWQLLLIRKLSNWWLVRGKAPDPDPALPKSRPQHGPWAVIKYRRSTLDFYILRNVCCLVRHGRDAVSDSRVCQLDAMVYSWIAVAPPIDQARQSTS